MGYYSKFEVVDTDIPDILAVLNELDTDYNGWESWNGNVCISETKWYDWITDLNELAVKYPDNYVVIERTGEESPDISRAVIKHGRVVEIEPELVWPEVD